MAVAGERLAGGGAGAAVVELIDAVRIARSAGSLLLDHAVLTAELAGSDWEAEKLRLKRLLFSTLLYVVFISLALLQFGALMVVVAWDTPYRIHAAAAVLLLWLVCIGLIRRRVQRIAADGEGRFAASRAELGKTVDILRRHL